MIYWLSPVPPTETTSGGTRKLGDLSCILAGAGIESRVIAMSDLPYIEWQPEDLVIIPEVFGHGLDTLVPRGIRRISFVQNGYLIDQFGCNPSRQHPFLDTPDLLAVMVESAHSETLVRIRVPNLQVPIIRTHSSGNGRMGEDAPFRYGGWPREKLVMFFGYKHSGQNDGIFRDLPLPQGWTSVQLTGSDDEVAAQMRSGAIFAAPNAIEGLCAPTQEAMISGCVIVAWPGGPSHYAHHPTPGWSYAVTRENNDAGGPMEYLKGRAVIASQDDVQGFRNALVQAANDIDSDPEGWAASTAKWSRWHQRTYSRKKEKAEIIQIMRDLTMAVAA